VYGLWITQPIAIAIAANAQALPISVPTKRHAIGAISRTSCTMVRGAQHSDSWKRTVMRILLLLLLLMCVILPLFVRSVKSVVCSCGRIVDNWEGVRPPVRVPACLPLADAPKRHSPHPRVPSCGERSRQGLATTPRESRGRLRYRTKSSSCGSTHYRGRVHHPTCSTGG